MEQRVEADISTTYTYTRQQEAGRQIGRKVVSRKVGRSKGRDGGAVLREGR